MEQLGIILTNLIGLTIMFLAIACYFKSSRKLLVKLLKYIWKNIELRGVILGLIKRFWNEIKTIKEVMQDKKERYMYLTCTVISFLYLLHRFSFDYILLFAPLVYFIFKALTKELREYYIKMKHEKVSSKYKDLSKIFDNKVKVIAFDKNTGIFKLNSFVPVTDIEKKSANIEHWLNKEIESIKRDPKNFRLIYIKTKSAESKKYKSKFKEKYRISEYIKNIDTSGYAIPFLLGIDENEKPVIGDLKRLKHLQISGQSEGGKTTFEHSFLQSLMYFNDDILYVLVDYKVVGLGRYRKINNTIFVTEDNFDEIINWLLEEMNKRKWEIDSKDLEDIHQYNKKCSEKMPYIVLMIDEAADINLSADTEKESKSINKKIARLLNQGRALGLYIVMATQRPSGVQMSTEVRAGLITKISYRVFDAVTQGMTGIKGTQDLAQGEFMIITELEPGVKKMKGFYVNRLDEWSIFEELKNKLGGNESGKVINLDKR